MSPANPDQDAELHARLLAGDPTASAELFDRHLTPVIEHLSHREQFRKVAATRPEMIWDAATDALFAYVRNPATYQPALRTLRGFLKMSAAGDLLNALAKDRRDSMREPSFDQDVELLHLAGNIGSGDSAAELRLGEAEMSSRIAAVVPDEIERVVAQMIIDGERSRDEFARILGILDLPDGERNREVDRVKDRLKKRLQRAWRAQIGGL